MRAHLLRLSGQQVGYGPMERLDAQIDSTEKHGYGVGEHHD